MAQGTLLPARPGGASELSPGAQKGLCGCWLPSGSWEETWQGEKKTFRSYWEDRDLCLAALENRIKGNLSGYSTSDVGTLFVECPPEGSSKGDLSLYIQEEHLTVYNCSLCLNKLPFSPDPAQLRNLWFLRG